MPVEAAIELVKAEKERIVASCLSSVEGGYEPAIFEVEREIQWTPSCRFPEGVRIVDTQGLNQYLPGDLAQIIQASPQKRTSDLVLEWLHKTIRGQHLLWQYRRCDAAIWLLHASKSQSNATRTIFPLFAGFGKKAIMVVTNIDRLPSESDRNKVFADVDRTYGDWLEARIPLDGKSALRAALLRDLDGEEKSGLSHLRKAIYKICVEDGIRTRAIGLYNALRVTEKDLRQALTTYHAEISMTVDRLNSYWAVVEQKGAQLCRDVETEIHAREVEGLSSLDARISNVGLWDNGDSADSKVGFAQLASELQLAAQGSLRNAERELHTCVREVNETRFELPRFDSRGNKAGTAISTTLSVTLRRFQLRIPRVYIEMGRAWGTMVITVMEWLVGLFNSEMRRRAEKEREDERQRRRAEVRAVCYPEWERLAMKMKSDARYEITTAVGEIQMGLVEVAEKLSKAEGESLEKTADRLRCKLESRVVTPILASRMVAAFRVANRMKFEDAGK
jgi:hypothetical protein